MKLEDKIAWEGRSYILRSGDDKAQITEETHVPFLLSRDAELIQHFEESPGKFRVDIRFRDIRFVGQKHRPFRFVPLKDPRHPLNT